jgi:aryl carrier-like protein
VPTGTQEGTPLGIEEQVLADLLCELLGLPSVSEDQNIFELTGDSITILKFVGRALVAGLKIDIVDVFETMTVAALAQRARENGGTGAEAAADPAEPSPLVSISQDEIDEIEIEKG